MRNKTLFHVDQLSLEFEDQLRAGQNPKIEDFIGRVDADIVEDLLFELVVLESDYRDDFPECELVARFPGHAKTIRRAALRRRPGEQTPYQRGDRLGRFTISQLVSTGNFGWVYQAQDNELGRKVALKIPRLRQASSDDVSETFRQEANALAQLQHNNLVNIHDIFLDEKGSPVLVLEYLQGASLSQHQSSDLHQKIDWLIQVCRGLDYAHQRGIVHRDLKPDNIQIDEANRAVVVDFGLSIHYRSQSFDESASAGTLKYMSPEQLLGDAHWIDGRSDIWSVGVMLYEIGCGCLPFSGEQPSEIATAIIEQPVRPPRQLNPKLSKGYEAICLRCLDKSADNRFSTAADLANELESLTAKSSSFSPAILAMSAVVIAFIVWSASQFVPRSSEQPSNINKNNVAVEQFAESNESGSEVAEKNPPAENNENGVVLAHGFDEGENTLASRGNSALSVRNIDDNFALHVSVPTSDADGPFTEISSFVVGDGVYGIQLSAKTVPEQGPVVVELHLKEEYGEEVVDTRYRLIGSCTLSNEGTWTQVSGGYRFNTEIRKAELFVRSRCPADDADNDVGNDAGHQYWVDDLKVTRLGVVPHSEKIYNGRFTQEQTGYWRPDRAYVGIDRICDGRNCLLSISNREHGGGVVQDVMGPFANRYLCKARFRSLSDKTKCFEMQAKRIYKDGTEGYTKLAEVYSDSHQWIGVEGVLGLSSQDLHTLERFEFGLFEKGSDDFQVDDLSVVELEPAFEQFER